MNTQRGARPVMDPAGGARIRSARVAPRGGDDRGAVLVLVAILVVVVAGMAAFVVDLGHARQESRHAQASSDAAALAGALELPLVAEAGAATVARQMAADFAVSNATGSVVDASPVGCVGAVPAGSECFVAGDVSVMVATPYSLATSPHPAHSLIFVRVCQPSGGFFGGVFGASDRTVCRDAVGRRVNATGGFGFGLVSLSRTACPGLGLGGDSVVVAPDSAVAVNSDCASALRSNGVSWRLSAASVGVVGGVDLAPCDPAVTTTCTDVVPTGIAHFDDPFAGIPIPDLPGLVRECNPPRIDHPDGGRVRVLEPGRYTSACNFNAPGGAPTYVLRPGLYYFEQGFTVRGDANLICANSGLPTSSPHEFGCDGVTFYVASGGFSFNGGSTLDIPAPTTGDHAGISVFQGPDDPSSSLIAGANYSNIGSVYAPAAGSLDLRGTGEINITGLIVADVVDLRGTFSLGIELPGVLPPVVPDDDVGLEN